MKTFIVIALFACAACGGTATDDSNADAVTADAGDGGLVACFPEATPEPTDAGITYPTPCAGKASPTREAIAACKVTACREHPGCGVIAWRCYGENAVCEPCP